MKVLVIGCGSIGVSLSRAMERMDEIETIYITDKTHVCSKRIAEKLDKVTSIDSVEEALPEVELVIEAASQEAVQQYGPLALKEGKDLMVMSLGALVDDKLRAKMENQARINGCRIIVPSGALVGIDGLLAVREENLEKVMLTTSKSPASLGENEYIKQQGIALNDIKEPTVVFQGRARDAVRLFPRNINVAATVSLAGIGFDRTLVKIVADPGLSKIQHDLLVEGEFGSFSVEVENVPSPKNPKTSQLAILSAIAALKRSVKGIWQFS